MRGLLLAGFALLALAPAARADVTIGSDLMAAPAPGPVVCDPNCTFSTASIPGRDVVAPAGGGVVTRWQISAGEVVSPVRLVVLRRTDGPTGPAEVVRRSEFVTPRANMTEVFETQLAIAAGEYIGIDCCPSSGAGAEFFAATGTMTDRWQPQLADGDSRLPTNQIAGEVLVNADVEPDRDGDGFGDETQDNCPANANPGQEDTNGDGLGNACDGDGDGFADAADACPAVDGVAPNGCPAAAAPPPAAPRVNQPPTVRFRTPLAGTAVGASQAIELEVSDDAGNPRVTLFDDDGTICTLNGPPYSCTWRPTGADVGRATLLASAVDSDNRSTLGIVRVKVSRFKARDLTLRRRGRVVSGRLVLPRAVERSLGCTGEVTVRRGKARRTTKLKRNCTYSVRLPRGSGRVRARFAGNAVLQPAT